MGMEAYLAELGLAERVPYDAQGNSYDPLAVEIRIAEGIRQWSNGGSLRRHEYIPPSQVQNVFQTVHDYVSARGLQAVDSPFPWDLTREMLAGRDGTDPVLSDTPGTGGGDGRDGMTMAAGNGRIRQ